MKSETLTSPEITLLSNLKVITANRLPDSSQDDLTYLYFQAWNSQGLCPDLTTARKTLEYLDPSQAYVAIDNQSRPYALIHTLPINAKNLTQLISLLPTYQSVMDLSHLALHPSNPNFRVCFSIVSLPGHKVLDNSVPISLSRYLLDHLPKEPSTFKLAYSRTPAIGMHQHYGALKVATLFNSRPQDSQSNGTNTLMLYPRNQSEAKLLQADLKSKPIKLPTAHLFLDI